jgi:hypothetical protein
MAERDMAKKRRGPIRRKPDPEPRRPDHYPIPEVSPEQQRLIGLVVLNWSKLETDIEAVIWAFLGLGIDAGRIITTRLNVDVKIELLRSLSLTYLRAEALDGMLNVLDFINIYKEGRNFVVHGSWGTLMPDNIPVCASLRPKAPPGEIISEHFPEERMINLVNGILEAQGNLRMVEEALHAAHDKLRSRSLPGSARLPQDQ